MHKYCLSYVSWYITVLMTSVEAKQLTFYLDKDSGNFVLSR